jgi:hypothetical protein
MATLDPWLAQQSLDQDLERIDRDLARRDAVKPGSLLLWRQRGTTSPSMMTPSGRCNSRRAV